MTAAVSALILAGSRPDGDPLARQAGVEHKALIDVAGRPMLDHVVAALRASPAIGRIAVSAREPLAVGGGELSLLPAEQSPSLSVRSAILALGTPLLVTTADHPLLRPEWIGYFLDHLPEADAVAALARSETVLAAVPNTERTFLRFKGAAFSGCNLFYFRERSALRVVDFWRRIEAQRKRPWRMAGLLGPGSVLAYLLGRLTIEAALDRLEQRTGARLGIVDMPFGEAAVDVDDRNDLDLVRRLMAARKNGAAATGERPGGRDAAVAADPAAEAATFDPAGPQR